MTTRQTIDGGCLCGGVRFAVAGPLRPVVACHCRSCRRQSGHFVAATRARRADVEIRAAETLAWWSASARARRGFCRRCGAGLFFEPLDADGAPSGGLSIWAGALEADPPPIAGHIFCAERGGYYEIEGAAPRYDGAGPDASET